MKKFNPEKELSKIRNGNKKKVIISICVLLVVGVLGYSFALYQVRHTNKLVFNTVGEFKKRDIYLSVLVDGEYQNDFPTKEEGMLYGGYECDGDAKINFDTEHWQVALYASHPDKCTIKFGHKYVDESGANYPELYQGMIPVYFENGKIYVADITSEWYNYDENKWANAVLIDYANKKDKFYDDNGNLLGGHEVSEEDILQMYVWIPRYKYQLWNVNNEGKPKQLINIKFEKNDETTGDITCTYENKNNGTIEEKCVDKESNPVENGDWYTHPAFTFGNTELQGIWVGKFEPSEKDKGTSGVINTWNEQIKDITILPNKVSLTNRNLNMLFSATQNINKDIKYNLNATEIDPHIAKNIEWGAVAYLTQSIYGIYKDENTCNINGMTKEDCEVWIDNVSHGATQYEYDGAITGCSGTSVDAKVVYNKETCEDGRTWEKEGVKASTTGNMYGIYDMSGGMWEYTMGNMVDSSGNFYSSNANFETELDAKYYDSYSHGTDAYAQQNRGHLGDSTREVLKMTSAERQSWNRDHSQFVYNTISWFVRGGPVNDHIGSGIFAFWSYNGGSVGASRNSFRIVLTAQDN